MSAIYAEWGPLYRKAGYQPLPVTPNTKACHLRDWQQPMSDAAFEASLSAYGRHGIGLLMGVEFPDGSRLAALDIDRDEFTRVGLALMGEPVCRRLGKKGIVIFCRIRGDVGNLEFRFGGRLAKTWGKHAELLAARKMVVIPPTIHPETMNPYRWLGPSLLNVTPDELPIIEA